MKLAFQQPFFFPYLNYFDLINRTDRWIFFDTAQYVKWVSRNRVLHPNSGWQYIIVPVKKHHQITPINQIEISTNTDWKVLVLRRLHHYSKDAQYYVEVKNFLEDCFSDSETNLARLNMTLFKKTCHRLGIEKPIHVYSEMNLTLPGPVHGPGDWGLRIAQAVGASELICLPLPAGAKYMDENKYMENSIQLTILPFTHMNYDCGRHQYEPDLSIIDVMMWNSPEKIKHYLDTFCLKTERGDAYAHLKRI
jgi:hypothetical protein